jgi:hypothetical protein
MNAINKGLRILIPLAVIVGAVYWGYTSTRDTTYSGSELSFEMGGGDTVINNPSENPVAAQLTTRGSGRNFIVASDALDTTISSSREGTGANTVNSAEIELPPGSTDLRLTRGSNVSVTITGETNVEATVSPVSSSGARTILVIVIILIVGSLYFISSAFDHRWLDRFRRSVPQQGQGTSATASN